MYKIVHFYITFFVHSYIIINTDKDKIRLKDSGLDKNAKTILNLMIDDPFCYPPNYEKLTGDLTGLYSRRNNRQHRIVYEVDKNKNEIHIIRM